MTAPRWLDAEEMRVWRSLLQASARLLDRLDDELLAAHEVSLPDYEVLVHLSEAPQRRRRMSELADRALMSRSRLTYRINRLEAAGLVVREACEDDRRGWFAVLTPVGQKLLEKAAPAHVAGVRRHLLDHIDRGELAPVADVLGRVAAALGSLEEHRSPPS